MWSADCVCLRHHDLLQVVYQQQQQNAIPSHTFSRLNQSECVLTVYLNSGLDVQVISPGIYFDLNRMQHRAALLATVINIYRLLLSMRNQLPALHNLMPDNIWVPRPDLRTEIMHVPAKQGHGGR